MLASRFSPPHHSPPPKCRSHTAASEVFVCLAVTSHYTPHLPASAVWGPEPGQSLIHACLLLLPSHCSHNDGQDVETSHGLLMLRGLRYRKQNILCSIKEEVCSSLNVSSPETLYCLKHIYPLKIWLNDLAAKLHCTSVTSREHLNRISRLEMHLSAHIVHFFCVC